MNLLRALMGLFGRAKNEDTKQVNRQVFTNSLGMTFVWVPPGRFWMGGGGYNCNYREVEIPRGFYLGAHLVTQEQWQVVMGDNPSSFSRSGSSRNKIQTVSDRDLAMFPVEEVSYDDVQHFLSKVNELSHESGWVYRLPLEAEWEYACKEAANSRADCSFHFYLGNRSNVLSSCQANFDGSNPHGGMGTGGTYLGRVSRVGSYAPNRIGLYDMHGNVWEWCEDFYDGDTKRVLRGGCYSNSGHVCRAGERNGIEPSARQGNIGFRVARVAAGGSTQINAASGAVESKANTRLLDFLSRWMQHGPYADRAVVARKFGLVSIGWHVPHAEMSPDQAIALLVQCFQLDAQEGMNVSIEVAWDPSDSSRENLPALDFPGCNMRAVQCSSDFPAGVIQIMFGRGLHMIGKIGPDQVFLLVHVGEVSKSIGKLHADAHSRSTQRPAVALIGGDATIESFRRQRHGIKIRVSDATLRNLEWIEIEMSDGRSCRGCNPILHDVCDCFRTAGSSNSGT